MSTPPRHHTLGGEKSATLCEDGKITQDKTSTNIQKAGIPDSSIPDNQEWENIGYEETEEGRKASTITSMYWSVKLGYLKHEGAWNVSTYDNKAPHAQVDASTKEENERHLLENGAKKLKSPENLSTT